MGFWTVTLLLCLLAGLGSFALGRNWVGRQLGGAITAQRVELKAQDPGNALGNSLTDKVTPPSQAKVEMAPRPPTEGEKSDLTAGGLNAVAANQLEAPAAPEATAPPSAGAATTGYQVTAGSFTSAANAERVRRDLEKRGYQPYVEDLDQRGVTYHRVIVGVWGDRPKAEEVRQQLNALGFVAGVTPQ